MTNNIEVVTFVASEETDQYRWKLVEGSNIYNVTVAMVMGRCVGAPTYADGSCVYQPPAKSMNLK